MLVDDDLIVSQEQEANFGQDTDSYVWGTYMHRLLDKILVTVISEFYNSLFRDFLSYIYTIHLPVITGQQGVAAARLCRASNYPDAKGLSSIRSH
jgi:hypothetical protein